MLRIASTADLRRGEELWNAATQEALFTDLWGFRACFQRHFGRPAHFVWVEEGETVVGLLPLSLIEETGTYGYFPGETWKGRTWLEGNRIFARDAEVLSMLLGACPANTELRYLLAPDFGHPAVSGAPSRHPLQAVSAAGTAGDENGNRNGADATPFGARPGIEVDEVGYLFSPPRYGFDVERWFGEFSFKNAKRLRRAIAEVAEQGLEYRFDEAEDIERMIEMNLSRFGDSSYFADRRFRNGFTDGLAWLRERGWLRITTVSIGGQPAAIDVGALYRDTYTMLAGGTHAGFPGIAKVINFHHLRTACAQRYRTVDFLCGDFAWKPLFHLEPRPLYRYDARACGQPAGIPANHHTDEHVSHSV